MKKIESPFASKWWTALGLPVLLFLFCLVVGTMLGSAWFHILPVLPLFSNPHEIVSPSVRNNFNPINNYLRFFLYLLSPLLLWAALNRVLRPWMSADAFSPEPSGSAKEWYLAALLLILISAFTLPSYFSFDKTLLNGFWFFEQGAWMVPGWQYVTTGKIWLGSFFAHGLLYDVFWSVWAWKLSGIANIASDRYMVAVLGNLLTPLNLLLLWSIAYFAFIHRRFDYRRATCLLLLVCTFFYSTHIHWQYWDRRDLPVLAGVVCFLFSFHYRLRMGLVVTGLLAGLAWLCTLERGAYFTGALILFYLGFIFITKRWKESLSDLFFLALGGLSSLFLLIFFVGWEEVAEGIRVSYLRMQTKDLVDGNAYPNPAFPISNFKFLASKFTFPLVCLAVQLMLFFSRWYAGKCKENNLGPWTTQLFLLLISLLYYRSALSRSDEVHWCYSSSFAFIGAAYAVGLVALESRLFQSKFLLLPALALVSIIPLQRTYGGAMGMKSFLSNPLPNLKEELRMPDSLFLTDQQKRVLPFLKEEFASEPCFYSIASEPFWSYLVQKPFCGRFYITWLIPGRSFQEEAIEEVKLYKPGKILMRTPLSGWAIDGIPISEQAKYLYAHLLEHYQFSKSLEGWEVWVRKK